MVCAMMGWNRVERWAGDNTKRLMSLYGLKCFKVKQLYTIMTRWTFFFQGVTSGDRSRRMAQWNL